MLFLAFAVHVFLSASQAGPAGPAQPARPGRPGPAWQACYFVFGILPGHVFLELALTI